MGKTLWHPPEPWAKNPVPDFARRVLTAACYCLLASELWCQGQPEYERPPIDYSSTVASNCVTELQQRIQKGELLLNPATEKAVLNDLLDQLDTPAESQVLVFSKTSLQRRSISPSHPRALYFSEDCYIGWVPGGLIELAVTDPELGLAFYRVELNPTLDNPRFVRDSDCLSCHGGSMTRDWPGLMVRSVFPDEQGEPILSAGTFLTEHDSPFHERWGGWYVTGRHGNDRHMGNVLASSGELRPELDRETGANLDSLDGFFDPEKYLWPGSDIVALMLLEHQVGMHNRFVQGALRSKRWIHHQRQLQKELGNPITDELTGTAKLVVHSEAERILEYLLFCDEAPLPDAGIEGDPEFLSAFRLDRRVAPSGRSLKDFDLQRYLFKYRCSYMIYSVAFESLPPQLKSRVYQRLQAVLTAQPAPERFSHLTNPERRAIHEILTATKHEFAALNMPDRLDLTTEDLLPAAE